MCVKFRSYYQFCKQPLLVIVLVFIVAANLSYSSNLDNIAFEHFAISSLCRRDVLMHCSLRCKISCGWKTKSWSSSRPSWQRARLQVALNLHPVRRSHSLYHNHSISPVLSDPPKRTAYRQRDQHHPHLSLYVVFKNHNGEWYSAHSKLNSTALVSLNLLTSLIPVPQQQAGYNKRLMHMIM